MVRTPLLAVSAVLLGFLSLSLAGCQVTKTPYSRSGLYAGAALAGNLSNFKDVGTVDLSSNDLAAGLALRGGYRFLDRFAFEVGYDYSDDLQFSGGVDVSLQSFSANGKFYPLTGRFQPYGVVGVGALDGKVRAAALDETEFFYRAGIGVEAYAARYFPVFVEFDYNVPSGRLDELQYSTTQIGVLFRF